jgi:hypothetical protein
VLYAALVKTRQGPPVTGGQRDTSRSAQIDLATAEPLSPGRFLRVRVDGGTLHQLRGPLVWNRHGYYEVSLGAGVLIRCVSVDYLRFGSITGGCQPTAHQQRRAATMSAWFIRSATTVARPIAVVPSTFVPSRLQTK